MNNDHVPLAMLAPGDKGTIARVLTGASSAKRRLLEMGLLKGTPIEVVRFAPLGDPIEVRVRGFRLSLRRIEAEAILVTKDPL
jgi:ferrous iron transport protein A